MICLASGCATCHCELAMDPITVEIGRLLGRSRRKLVPCDFA
jgi:hypothetical protein